MPNNLSKFFNAPLFDQQKRSDQAKLMNWFLMIGLIVLLISMVIMFFLGGTKTSFFILVMAVYLLANKALLQMKRYLGASWVFLIGITLVNFVFGGMFPEFPLLAITLPFLVVSACILLNVSVALLVMVINLVVFAAFVQPVWGGNLDDIAPLGAIVFSSTLVLIMINQYVKLKEKHFNESQKLCKQIESEYHTTVTELKHTKDALLSEYENKKTLETKRSVPSSMNTAAHRFNPHTGIMTEEAVKGILSSEIARTRRYQRPLSLLSIKIDDFDYVVEQTDLAAERLLSVLGDLFIEALRVEDLIGHSQSNGFYVILPETGRYASYVVGERLRHRVEVMTFANLGDINITVSVGITAFQDQSKMTPERFIEQSNEAVEAAISHGGNWTISWHDLSHTSL